MRIVVVGGGFGGVAASARLAKLGHEVTLLEAGDQVGGALLDVVADGFSWDGAANATLLPAVVRDLFRKSGRPLEQELELEPLEVIREHRFEDLTSVRVVGGSRAAQLTEFDKLDPGCGDAWVKYVESYADAWEVLRQNYFEKPWDRDAVPADLARLLDGREMLHRRLRRTFRDDRLRDVAAHPFVAEGHDLRNVPAWAGVSAYLEQRFGAWRFVGGTGRLAAALTERLTTRRVDVRAGAVATDLVVREGRVAAVATAAGEIDCDAVVVAIDPRRLPTLRPLVDRTMPALPPVMCHVGLRDEDLPDLPAELVVHGDPEFVIRTGGRAPEGHVAWTIHGRGKLAEDLLTGLARHQIDLRAKVVTRIDRSPRDLVEGWHGSPLGVLWQGRGTVRQRLGPTTPVPGVYAVGAHATPGTGLPYVGLSAALVAQVIGSA